MHVARTVVSPEGLEYPDEGSQRNTDVPSPNRIVGFSALCIATARWCESLNCGEEQIDCLVDFLFGQIGKVIVLRAAFQSVETFDQAINLIDDYRLVEGHIQTTFL